MPPSPLQTGTAGLCEHAALDHTPNRKKKSELNDNVNICRRPWLKAATLREKNCLSRKAMGCN